MIFSSDRIMFIMSTLIMSQTEADDCKVIARHFFLD